MFSFSQLLNKLLPQSPAAGIVAAQPISRRDMFFGALIALFICALVMSNILASKLWVLWGVVIPAGVITYPLTFLVTDVISEVWGKKAAQYVVRVGFVCCIVALLLGWLAVLLPAASFYDQQEFFKRLFGTVGRVTFAGLIAYMVSQTFDVWLFHLIRERTGADKLWLRNNVATVVSQLWDTLFFIVIAFAGVVPASELFSMVLGQWTIKIIFALCDTPFCYLLVALGKKVYDE